MGIAATILALVLIEVDTNTTYSDLPIDWFLYSGNKAGARSVLSTIASSMATIAGVTFSMTLVALTMASSQFGPRLLRNFIADKGNQLVLGTFISTFIYSLIVLLTIRESDNENFIPKVSIIVGFLLAVCSLGVLIYFIHHIASSIEAEQVIKSSFTELCRAIDRFMSDKPASEPGEQALMNEISSYNYKKVPVRSVTSGYLQYINYDDLCSWASKHDCIIVMQSQPGDFVTIYDSIATIHAPKQLKANAEEDITDALILNSKRTPDQEIGFSIQQIVEVAVRALSPGINDPHTAIACIKWLGAALAMIANKSFPSRLVTDDKDKLRVVKKPNSYQKIVNTCFDQMRIYAKSNIFVSSEMLIAIEKGIRHATNEDLKVALKEKATIIFTDVKETHSQAHEYPEVRSLYESILSHY
jgi:uncharacterized membrane protein